MMDSISKRLISVVIPIYNEESNLPFLMKRLNSALDKEHIYEIIFVNDGSFDSSEGIIKQFIESDSRIKLISFSRNFGHQEAISAGLEYARGEAVIIMDGDLQDPPEVLGQFIRKWEEGWDVVYAVRRKRKENVFKRFAYFAFYRILKRLSTVDLPLDSGDFCLLDRRIVNYLNSLPERNRFLRGMRAWIGFKQTGLEYEREGRFSGEPKYTLYRLVRLALNGIISFSYKPLVVAMHLGLLTSFAALIGVIVIFCIKVFTARAIPGWTSIIILVLFMGSIQLFAIGALGEYIGRIFDEVKQRPNYIISEKIGIENGKGRSD